MGATVFLLIRHAAVDALGRKIVGRAPGVHLNSEGRSQARCLAGRLAGARITAIYSSPLERAQETAMPIAERVRSPVQTEEDLNEIDYGAWTAKTFEELNQLPEWHHYNANRSEASIPGGETVVQLRTRACAAIARLRQKHPGEIVALVTHADWIRTAAAALLGVCLDSFIRRFDISPASVGILRSTKTGFILTRWNDNGELPGDT